MSNSSYWSRRTFLQSVGAGIPTVSLMSHAGQLFDVAASDGTEGFSSAKFTPIALNEYFTASPKQFGPRDQARARLRDSREDGLIYLAVPGKELFSAPVASYMLTLINGLNCGQKPWPLDPIRNDSHEFGRCLRTPATDYTGECMSTELSIERRQL